MYSLRHIIEGLGLVFTIFLGLADGFVHNNLLVQRRRQVSLSLDLDSLMDMDVVVYSIKDDKEQKELLGALQEDGVFSPLSVWTTEPAFGESIEFLVDEEDRFALDPATISLHHLSLIHI